VVACVRLASGTSVQQEVRTFGTATGELLALVEWLTSHGGTPVAMESTGIYWKPVWHVLEGHVELVLANALQIRRVPGRKTDVNDATWIADWLAHGLIRSSFVPPAPIQALRDLTRTRKQLVREIAQHTLRLQTVLEDAHLKLTSVISDVLDVSGRAMIAAIIGGETDPERLADLSQGRLKASRLAVVAALHGRVTPHHWFLLRLHLTHIDTLEGGRARGGDALGRDPRALSECRRPTHDHSRRSPDRRARDRGGNRPRHEPVPDGWTRGVVGRPLSASGRKRRPAPLDAHATRGALAHNRAGSSGLGRHAHP
jgi:hypothetical protein